MSLHKLHAALRSAKKKLALAESCTGGAIAEKLISLPGASDFFLGSIVAYSNEWKHEFLGVSEKVLREEGAVSLKVVEQMVQGLMRRTKCDLAAAVSGIAGPTGGTPEKPVGTVCVGIGVRDGVIDLNIFHFSGDRLSIIKQTTREVLKALLRKLHG